MPGKSTSSPHNSSTAKGPSHASNKTSLTNAILPNAYKKLRACRECRLIKTEEQFMKDGGCENCPSYEISDVESLEQYTSANFDGLVSVII
jgi:hypothetical protein